MLTYSTSRPQGVLDAFKKAIKDGHITTWSEDSDGDFTHKAAQWKGRAWLRPHVNAGSLTFNIIASTNEKDRRTVYSFYHGHHIETFINHFPNDFSEACATANPAGSDSTV